MAIIVNPVEFEQVQADLIVNKLPVGGVLRIERGERRLDAKSLAPAGVKFALLVHRLQAHVVELGVEFDFLARFRINVDVISGLRRARRRKRQRILHKSVAQLGEFLSDSRSTDGSAARYRQDSVPDGNSAISEITAQKAETLAAGMGDPPRES